MVEAVIIGLALVAFFGVWYFLDSLRGPSRRVERATRDAEVDLRYAQEDLLRQCYPRNEAWIAFGQSAYEESVRRRVNIWIVYRERLVQQTQAQWWDLWCLAWSAIGLRVARDSDRKPTV